MSERDVRIVDDDERSVSFGSVGEIEVRSPGLMSGYWNDEAKTRQAVHGGWLKTGDMGYFDGEGFLYIVDRRNDMIVTGGENVFPTEVESVLYEDPVSGYPMTYPRDDIPSFGKYPNGQAVPTPRAIDLVEKKFLRSGVIP